MQKLQLKNDNEKNKSNLHQNYEAVKIKKGILNKFAKQEKSFILAN